MIYFKEDLVEQVLSVVKDAHDIGDIGQDLDTINKAIANMRTIDDLLQARNLDEKLRRKYPCINELLDVAQAMTLGISGQAQGSSDELAEVKNLRQDYYGIICGTAVKKGIVQELKDMIKQVN